MTILKWLCWKIKQKTTWSTKSKVIDALMDLTVERLTES